MADADFGYDDTRCVVELKSMYTCEHVKLLIINLTKATNVLQNKGVHLMVTEVEKFASMLVWSLGTFIFVALEASWCKRCCFGVCMDTVAQLRPGNGL